MVTSAPRWRRWLATSIDVALIAPVLWVASRLLPKGGPPADAMSFYSEQDFRNYMMVVLWAVLATAAAVMVSRMSGTPGDRLAGIRLVASNSSPLSSGLTAGRAFFAVAKVLFVMLPGPIIALIVAMIASSVLSAPLMTADAALKQLGFSAGARYSIHALSFVALGIGLWFVALRPIAQRKARSTEPTTVDGYTGSTYVLRASG